MRNLPFFGVATSLILALGAAPAFAIVIDPAQCGTTLSCETGTETSNSAILATIESLHPGITEVYKQNVGGGESGSFADNYSTAFFNTPSDPEDALITWDGPAAISCPNCYLLAKDGNQDPAWYLIDISGWDGMEDLDLQNFWPQQGAISHVSLFVQPIPIPAAFWLFGCGLLSLVGVARRKVT